MTGTNYSETLIGVLIVEDNDATREGLVNLLESSEGFKCLNSFSSCEEALEKLDKFFPQIVLMDIGLKGMSGIEGVEKIKETYPSLTVLMLTVFDDEEKIFRAIKAGADGYILKKTEPQNILRSIREAYLGGSPITPSIAKKVLNEFSKQVKQAKKFDLTETEIEILKYLVDGSSFEILAKKLDRSIHTVRSHVRNIYSKLYVHSKTEAVVKALKHRII